MFKYIFLTAVIALIVAWVLPSIVKSGQKTADLVFEDEDIEEDELDDTKAFGPVKNVEEIRDDGEMSFSTDETVEVEPPKE